MLEPTERRKNLRRLDDILEALEQLNLNDQPEITQSVAESLVAVGIENPFDYSITQLIEKVWAVQQPFLITLVTDRRRRRRRQADMDAATSLQEPPTAS
jgi:hypothetical protein